MRFTFGVIFRSSFFHVDRQDPGGVFQTVAGNILVCKVGSSIMVSNLRDKLLVVDTMFAVCMELSPTAPGTVGIGALGVVCAVNVDHHNNSVEDVDCGHWDCAHAGDVANHTS